MNESELVEKIKPDIVGKRVRLVHTNDPDTELRPGDMGTGCDITEIPFENIPIQLWIHWDSGSKLCLLDGVDSYDIVD